jgi:hypothetical protein
VSSHTDYGGFKNINRYGADIVEIAFRSACGFVARFFLSFLIKLLPKKFCGLDKTSTIEYDV